MLRRALTVALAVALLAPLTACTAGTQGPTASGTGTPAVRTLPPAEVPPLTVEVRQSRSDWAARVVQLRVVSGAEEAFDVRSAMLATPTTKGVAVTDPGWTRRVPAGRAREASVALGSARCGPTSLGPAEVRLEVADEAGRVATVDVVATDPQRHLARIQQEDCARAAVEAGLRLTFQPDVVVRGDGPRSVATLTLVLDPVPGGPAVAVERLDGTVLLEPIEGTSWPVGPEAVVERTVVALPLRPARCDAHAVAEDKRGTFLAVHATVDGRPQPVWYLGTGGRLRGQLHDFIARHCGW